MAFVILGEAPPDNLNELRARKAQSDTAHRGVKAGVDPTKLAEAGWGVIFPRYATSDPDRDAKQRQVEEIREALQPLLQWRRKQAGERFAAWTMGEGKGMRVGLDSKNDYLDRHGVGPGPADPDKVPYYLLIVGDPADIPYRFQTQLDVQYAVGRIHFATVQEYADYAASVVDAESSPLRLPRHAAIFNVANPDDPATQRTASQLVAPLTQRVQGNHPDWSVQSFGAAEASKARLASLLGGEQTPAVLFTASHGMRFAKDSPRQLPHQGALLCQDWPGPEQWRDLEIPQDFYFAGDDLTESADLLGLIAFFYACYGGGTPQFNEFQRRNALRSAASPREEIAPYPFLARLPTRMLGRPRGALAVVGHVERTWTTSFDWGRAGSQTTVFESTLMRLLDGHPIGSALEYFNERYAELSTMLSDKLEEIDQGDSYDALALAGMWMANNDARGYAIIGDPAVRLPVARGAQQPVARPAIEVRTAAHQRIPRTEPGVVSGNGDAEPAEATSPRPVLDLSAPAGRAPAEVRTYVSENLADPPAADLRIVTRRAADGAIETTVHPEAVGHPALLALHQAFVEQVGKN